MNPTATGLITTALKRIDNALQIHPVLSYQNSDSLAAADLIKKACQLEPGDPFLRYAYCCLLQLSLQGASATEELQELISRHPDFALARFTKEAWDKSLLPNIFAYPEWSLSSNLLPPFYSEPASGAMLWPAREGIYPRAVFFEKDPDGWWTPAKLQNLQIDVAIVFTPSNPKAAGIYRKCSGPGLAKPDIQESIVVLGTPKHDVALVAWLHVCQDESLDVAISNQDGKVVMNKRITLSDISRKAVAAVREALLATPGRQLSKQEWLLAVQNYQNAADVDYIQRAYF